ncbi:aspartyl/asparaginyl beta-hydroxylase domain-containing protein [Phenylobacterium soli]|uniref:aspartyl/asparaginyl beta-hydroxylase domain-containing protein n=1 Tax=Phenylobacterium soli TaxID=2170551 RepID=UPI0010577E6D|nr:aspartyl/asparaginyl beta-hydroxylase domain-containing protein [Phenylobacterium soli]
MGESHVQAIHAPDDVVEQMGAAAKALAAGDAGAARQTLQRVLAKDPRNLPAWLNLAAAARAMNDYDAALGALEGALKLDPRNFFALLGRATLLERMGQAKAAAHAYGVALTQVPPDDRLDPNSRRAVAHARAVHARHVDELEGFIRDSLAAAIGDPGPSAARRASHFIDLTLRKRTNYRQEPVEFFYPGLPAIEFYDRELFPWLAELEAATADIRKELIAVFEEDAQSLVPYIDYPDSVPLDQWAELNRSKQWSAYHLYLYGERVEENCRRTPRTMEAISLIPQPQVPRRSPAAMFSVLQPRTRIPPHTGVANTRLLVHLPLIVPEGCGFRVGGETRPWTEGEAWVFDDTVQHEAWNESDERRTILICDLWSPFLSEVDREIITRVMDAMDVYTETAPSSDL